MSSFDDLVSNITVQYNDKVLKYCGSFFKHFDVGEFWYYSVTNTGHFTYLDSHCEFAEYLASEILYLTYPHFRNPKLFKSGVVVLDSVCDPVVNSVVLKMRQFNLHFPMKIVQKFEDRMECFGFALNSPSISQLGLLVNELPLLKLFVHKFKEDNCKLFGKLQDHQIDLGRMIGPSFSEAKNPNQGTLDLPSRLEFIREVRCYSKLNIGEIRIMRLILLGYSAGMIASKIKLSKRTVEHQIERLKGKLNCQSKADLVQKGREIEAIGLLSPNGNT